MTTRVGRTIHSSAYPIPAVSTASGYLPNAAFGSAFQLTLVCGVDGALLSQLCVQDRGTAGPALRVHFFSTAVTPTTDGSPFTIQDADFTRYLGYVNVGTADYVSAGTARLVAQAATQNIGLYSRNGDRSVYAQCQYITGNSAMGAVSAPIALNMVTLQD